MFGYFIVPEGEKRFQLCPPCPFFEYFPGNTTAFPPPIGERPGAGSAAESWLPNEG
jgi:hypothetical protein